MVFEVADEKKASALQFDVHSIVMYAASPPNVHFVVCGTPSHSTPFHPTLPIHESDVLLVVRLELVYFHQPVRVGQSSSSVPAIVAQWHLFRGSS